MGCYVGSTFVGLVGYADDLFLISPSLDGLQEMLKVCEKYAYVHNLKCSTDLNPNQVKDKMHGLPSKGKRITAHETLWKQLTLG